MKEELFAELVASVREGGAILRGEIAPSRVFAMDKLETNSIHIVSGPWVWYNKSGKWNDPAICRRR